MSEFVDSSDESTQSQSASQTDEFDIGEVGELTAVKQLQDQLHEVWRDLDEQLDDYIRRRIKVTDWEDTQVLDVIVESHTSDTLTREELGDLNVGWSVQCYNYVDYGPDPELYAPVKEDTAQLIRITEQVCRGVGIDPETGQTAE